MNVQWYPGHMVKAEKKIKENLSLIDLVIEIRDARAPLATANPRLDELASNKPRLVILNKADLADEEATSQWYETLNKSFLTIAFDSLSSNPRKVYDAINKLAEPIQKKREQKGLRRRSVRTMVIGVPNVGKSSFINRLAKRSAMKTGQKPGVTRGQQWLRVSKGIELLDTPGVLWPKFEKEETGLILAWIGCISDHVFDVLEVVLSLIKWLLANSPGTLVERYDLSLPLGDPLDIVKVVGTKRGCLLQGGKVDYEKAAHLLLGEFRSGKLGNFTLETSASV